MIESNNRVVNDGRRMIIGVMRTLVSDSDRRSRRSSKIMRSFSQVEVYTYTACTKQYHGFIAATAGDCRVGGPHYIDSQSSAL